MRVRRAGRAEVRALERIDRDVDRGQPRRDGLADAARPTFSPMKSIGALSRSPSPMHDGAVDRHAVQHSPHGLDRRLVGLVAVALPHRVRARDGRLLDDAEEFEREVGVHESRSL